MVCVVFNVPMSVAITFAAMSVTMVMVVPTNLALLLSAFPAIRDPITSIFCKTAIGEGFSLTPLASANRIILLSADPRLRQLDQV